MLVGGLFVLYKAFAALRSNKKKQPIGSKFEPSKMSARDERDAKMWGKKADDRTPGYMRDD